MEFIKVVSFGSEVTTVNGTREFPCDSRSRLLNFAFSHPSLLDDVRYIWIIRHSCVNIKNTQN